MLAVPDGTVPSFSYDIEMTRLQSYLATCRLTLRFFSTRFCAAVLICGALFGPPAAAGQPSVDGHDANRARPADTVVIEPVGNKLEFATKEIKAPSGTQLTIVMNNTATSPAMHHNVAILELAVDDEDGINAVGAAALQAGESSGYIPNHDAIVAATPMAPPGERTEVTFTVPAPGSYPFVCFYPGHYVVMRGVLVSTP